MNRREFVREFASQVFSLLPAQGFKTMGDQTRFCYAVADFVLAEQQKLREACEAALDTIGTNIMGESCNPELEAMLRAALGKAKTAEES